MTQRERVVNAKDSAATVGVYDAASTTTAVTTASKPTDLIRWGPILGGLFAALATLITLGVLGLAVGLSAYDANDPLGGFGIGAGIWGAITALIAFFVGGWVAARSAAFAGRSSGLFNGAMVWFVAIPMLVYLLGSGIGGLARTAGSVASTAANPAVQATAGAITNDPATQATAGTVVDQAQATTQAAVDSVTPQDVNNVADTAGRTAWSVLLSLGLAALASILGGYAGSRPRDTTVVRTA